MPALTGERLCEILRQHHVYAVTWNMFSEHTRAVFEQMAQEITSEVYPLQGEPSVNEQTPQFTFEEATIRIRVHLEHEYKEHPGKMLKIDGKATGLGYWGISIYAASHIPSGYGIKGAFHDERCMQQFLCAIAPLIDWNQSKDDLVADAGYAECIQKVNALWETWHVEDAAATAGWGAW